MSIKINITKKRQKKKKLKVNILYIIITFYRIFFHILFLLEETSKIKSAYGKQDYQPSAKIKAEKKIKTVKKMVKNKAACFVRLPICIHFYAVIAPYSNILVLTIRQMSNI